jgi:hypothetical protein
MPTKNANRSFNNTLDAIKAEVERLADAWINGNHEHVLNTVTESTPANMAWMATALYAFLPENEKFNWLNALTERATDELGPM